MTLLATLLMTGVVTAPQDAKTYSDDKLDLKFQYQADWKLERRKNDDVFRFKTSDGNDATIQIFRFFFRQEKAKWQEMQRTIAGQMGWRIARQWEEQILGVPLLMTRIEYNAQGTDRVVLVGLLYVAREQKLNFRLTSTLGSADEAEKTWRNALLTLRTVSGAMPVPEDPSKPLPNATQTATGDSVRTFRAEDPLAKPVRTSNVVKMSKSGRTVNVHLPKGWTLVDDEGRMTLHHDRLRGRVKFEISVGTRDQALGQLREANSQAFDRFKIVRLREAPKGALSKAGAFVISSLRFGSTPEDAELSLWYIIGSAETMVWKVEYESSSQEDLESDRKQMGEIRKLLAVVIAQ